MKKTLIVSLAVLAVAVLATSAVLAKKDDNKSSNKGKSKSEIVKEFKNYEKPTKGKTNASIHKEKINKVSTELRETAEKEKNKGQQNKEEKAVEKKVSNLDVEEQEQDGEETGEEIAEELEEVAEETEEAEDETVEAIGKAEKEGGFKKFFVGADYKNLGQLRSSLVHNRNQIRKLTTLSESVTDEETKTVIDEQLTTLMNERERIKTVISGSEGGFSLLGWVFRFINGYPKDSIDEEEETDLEEEVAEVIEEEVEEAEGDENTEDEQEGNGTEEETEENETEEEETQEPTTTEN